MTAPVITGPGEYVMRDSRGATLVGEPHNGWIMGFIEGETFPRVWDVLTGSQHPSKAINYSYHSDIVSPRPPKAERKRVEGWVCVDTKRMLHPHFQYSPNCALSEHEAVPVREVSPDDHVIPGKAWDEAKAMVSIDKLTELSDRACYYAYWNAFNRLRQEIEP